MQFNSLIFLFLFLPVFLLVFYMVKPGIRHYLLLLTGFFLYAWGQKEAVFILIFLILINYYLSVRISEAKNGRKAKRIFLIAVLLNILVLIFYKYLTFLLGIFGIYFRLEGIPYPVGISFYTFLAISYLTDIYRRSVPFQRGLSHYALYISLFPKLITGPITVYSTFKDQLVQREISLEDISWGIKRFVSGLGKKVLLADFFAKTADNIFSIPADRLNSPVSWIGIIAYSLQIYYDFSGYSDMAIGLGRMIGFRIPENFNYPYFAESIKDFWDRWHITLGQWLKKYLFLPIAYSVMRMTKKERILKIRIENWGYLTGIVVTFILCGLWHGAAWTFILWGFYYGLLLALEHLGIRKRFKKSLPLFTRIGITQFFVLIGWVFFRSDDLMYSFQYLKAMFGFGDPVSVLPGIEYFLNTEFIILGSAGVLLSLPLVPLLKKKINRISSLKALHIFIENIFYLAMFILGVMAISAGTYKPFIYFRF